MQNRLLHMDQKKIWEEKTPERALPAITNWTFLEKRHLLNWLLSFSLYHYIQQLQKQIHEAWKRVTCILRSRAFLDLQIVWKFTAHVISTWSPTMTHVISKWSLARQQNHPWRIPITLHSTTSFSLMNLKIALDQKPADNKYGSTIMLNLIGQYFYILNEN